MGDFYVLVETLMQEDADKRVEALRRQIEKGRDLNSCCSYGYSVLQEAAGGGHVECVRFSLEAGANVNSADDNGETSLMKAAHYGHFECMRLLLEAGANVNDVARSGKHTALIEAATFGYVECVRLLIEAGANMNVVDIFVRTALMLAANDGNTECVGLLLQAGANVNQSDAEGKTALMYAASRRQTKANLNDVDRRRKTALMEAATFGHAECVRVLLEAGANVNDVDMRRNTTLLHCLMYNVRPIEPVLVHFGPTPTPSCHKATFIRAFNAPIHTLRLLVEAGADIDAQNYRKVQPIQLALRRWTLFKLPAEYLISGNCNLSDVSYDKIQVSCYKNIKEDRLDILKLLFACGLPRHLCQSFVIEQETSVRNWINN